LAEGVLALALLVSLQLAITWLSVRSERFQQFVKAQPRLVLHRGRFLDEAMREERVTREEVLAAIRSHGMKSASEALAVVLETDGSISVVGDSARHRTDRQDALEPILPQARADS
jgi:uncharacterized membrane protein YcaP (DUF421 family)